jgi:hypothetical protein
VDEYVANLQVFAEQVPTAAIVYAKVTSSNRAGLSVLPFTGTTPEGNRYSWTLYQATLMDEAGRMSRFEIFGDDRWDDAVALFEQWAAESEVPTRDAPVTKWPAEEVPVHEASTDGGPASSAQPVSAAFAARDWDWIRARVAPDMALEDRRSTVSSHRAVGADAVVDLFRGFADVGFETLDNIHLASRGDRLALLRRVYRTATGFELEMLVVVETHVDGLMASLVLFDAEALVPALDELEVRYARSGAMNRTERPVLIGFAALNHRHWRELDAVQSPSVEVVDHRRLGFPASTGPTGLVLALESLVTQVPDVVAIVQELEVSGPAALASVRQVGTSIDGTAADWAWVNVIAIDRNGRIHRLEYFDAEDEPAARARFEELARRGV